MNTNVIKKYLEIEKLLNIFFKKTNFCIKNCISQKNSLIGTYIRGNIGCCDQDYLNYVSDIDKKFPDLRNIRLKLYGKPKNIEMPIFRGQPCSYHTQKGCILKTHKPIPCLSWICKPFIKHLKEKYKINYNVVFIKKKLEKIISDNLSDSEFKDFKRMILEFIDKVKN